MLDVEDLADIPKPDERSVMTYVAQYFHAFSTLGKFENSGRRLGKFAGVVEGVWQMQHEYEKRVQALVNSISSLLQTWSKSTFDGSYADAKAQSLALVSYKLETKRAWVTEKRELDSLLGNINTKLSTYKLKPYIPPNGLTLADLENLWSTLVLKEASRRKEINTQIHQIKESLQKEFADLANNFQTKLNQLASSLANLPAELELPKQLEEVKALSQKLTPLDSELPSIEEASQKCAEAGIEENDYTIYALEDLQFEIELFKLALKKKATFIENQV